jgi:hypothetical protein
MEWTKFYYKGLETNVEITKCGRVRKIKVDWYGNGRGSYKIKIGEIDFTNMKLSRGYNQITVQIKELKQRKTILLHQLVAATFLGYKFQGHKLVVDHIDSNKRNNRVDNLKIVTVRENTSKERTIKSGLPVGVCFCKRDKKYYSMIYINKKSMFLGSFNTIEDASNAYQQKLKSLN